MMGTLKHSVFQPRFVAFAKSNGAASEEQDTRRYVVWVSQQWSKWERESGERRVNGIRPKEQHAAFDQWLSEKVAS